MTPALFRTFFCNSEHYPFLRLYECGFLHVLLLKIEYDKPARLNKAGIQCPQCLEDMDRIPRSPGERILNLFSFGLSKRNKYVCPRCGKIISVFK
jgi:ribosomal protein S27AE